MYLYNEVKLVGDRRDCEERTIRCISVLEGRGGFYDIIIIISLIIVFFEYCNGLGSFKCFI